MKKRGDDSQVEMEVLLEDGEERTPTGSSFDARPHVLNITNCIVGVSVLAMPYCFQQCGILLAVVIIGLCSVITKLTCHFLFAAATVSRVHSYEALASTVFGHAGRRAVEVLMLAFLMSSIVAYIVVIGDLGPHIVADYLELAAPTQRLRVLVMVLVMFFVIIPLSTIKDLQLFSVVSSVACLFYIFFVFRIFLESLEGLFDGEWSRHVLWWRSEGFLVCLPIVMMALACQTQLFHVTNCIKSPTVDQVDSVVSHAINLCSAMYAAVGLFGYVAFYSRHLHGDVLVELAPTYLTQLLKLSFMLSIAVSVPLMLFPARHALFNLCLRPAGCELPLAKIQKSTFNILTAIILLGNLMIAIFVPNVEFILGLTGSLIGSLVTIIIPSAMYLQVFQKTRAYTYYMAKVCLVAGFCLLLLSTYVTLTSEQKSNIAAKPQPKEGAQAELAEDVKALESLEKLEERVLDANLNISQKLDDISQLAAEGKKIDAKEVMAEIHQQQEEQRGLLEKQEQLVDKLNKHLEHHQLEKKVEEERKEGEEDAKKKEKEVMEEIKEENKTAHKERTTAKQEKVPIVQHEKAEEQPAIPANPTANLSTILNSHLNKTLDVTIQRNLTPPQIALNKTLNNESAL